MRTSSTQSSQGGVIHELQHAARQYRLVTSDEEILHRTGSQIIQACQLQITTEVWFENFKLMVEFVQQWSQERHSNVLLTLVELRSNKLVFFIVPRSEQFDFDLASEQGELDAHLNARGAIGYVESRQVPAWELDRFVSPRAYRVWPKD